jgi:hypothetical protein
LSSIDAIPSIWHTVETEVFLSNWRDWWPFIHPRRLTVVDVCGHELGLGVCEYLSRVTTLECEGVVINGINGWGHRREEAEWRPVASRVLGALTNSPYLQQLTALKIEPIAATPADLLQFAESRLVRRLGELLLWVEFPDASREDLRAEKGFVAERIRDFVAEHAARFSVQPA